MLFCDKIMPKIPLYLALNPAFSVAPHWISSLWQPLAMADLCNGGVQSPEIQLLKYTNAGHANKE